MSDGRGGGSMRGPPRGGRGGGGGGRGGGGGGSMRGPPGDRGGGHGDRGRGGRGGDGGRGRGDRGGGGGRGDRGRGRGKVIFSPRSVPDPDQTVGKLEDKYEANMKDPLSLDKLSLAESQYPLRPHYGTKGQPVLLRTNYFAMDVDNNLGLHRYRIEVAPDQGRVPAGKQLKWIIKLFLEQHFDTHRGRIATDYKATLISRQSLEVKDAVFDVTYRFEEDDQQPENPRVYRVRVQDTGTITIATLLEYLASAAPNAALPAKEEIVQALNIIVGHHPKSQSNVLTVAGNKHYVTDPADNYDLGNGLEALRGYFVSVRPATAQLLVNIQVKHTACYLSGPLRSITDQWKGGLYNLHKFLRRVRVRLTHLTRNGKHPVKVLAGLATKRDGRELGRPPRITGPEFGAGPKQVEFYYEGPSGSQPPAQRGGSVRGGGRGRGKGKGPAPQPESTGRYISVFDYFQREYQLQTDPKRPVVNFGNTANPMYVPAELCDVQAGQACNMKLDSFQTSRMINFAVRTPAANATSIVQNGVRVIGAAPTPAGILANMGIEITPEMITVRGRVLPSPTVHYSPKQRRESIEDASWNLRGIKQMTSPVKLPQYAVLHFRDGPRDDEPFDAARKADDLARFASGYDMGLGRRVKSTELTIDLRPNADIDGQVDNAFAKAIDFSPAPKLLFVFLPSENTPIYNRLKYNGDVVSGIHTVCMVRSKLAKNPDSYFGNQVPKINLKLGGVNQTLSNDDLGIISTDPTMVVGIDVTHPSPGSLSTAPSIASMVASVDHRLGQWPAIIRLQHQARNEMVDDLRGMLETRLRVWQTANKNHLPNNILIYRDGVSEGQYNLVLETELPRLRECCEKVYPAKAIEKGFPRISIIVVGKRHHTRFYPTKEDDADSASNPKSGTIVDRGITENRNWNFFLQAHKALKGTARPAHYFVVLDEIFRQAQPQAKKGQESMGPVDRLEDLTHKMCYLFGRATKAVSICPPAYYADLVCDRARRYLSHQYDSTPAESVVSGQTSAEGPTQQDVVIHPSLANSMFYV